MIAVVFNWSPLVMAEREPGQTKLPSSQLMKAVPRQGDHIDFEDENVGKVKHVTWDLTTGAAYVYVDVP